MGFGMDRKAKDWRDDWQDADEPLVELGDGTGEAG